MENTGKAPKGDILLKVAQYFEVPVDFLLQRPPFDYWEAINADRRGLIAATGIDHDLLKIVWGIDAFDPYACRLKDFVSFLSLELLSAIPLDDGSWGIVLRPEHQKAPTQQPGERSTAQNDEEEEMRSMSAGYDSGAAYRRLRQRAAGFRRRERECGI